MNTVDAAEHTLLFFSAVLKKKRKEVLLTYFECSPVARYTKSMSCYY